MFGGHPAARTALTDGREVQARPSAGLGSAGNLARVLHAHDALLPSHLVGDKSLVAWCAAPRLAAALIQYRYTSA